MSFERQKFIFDKYYDIVKLRAAQVLALFIAYGVALQNSKAFLDSSSILAMAIPLIAWFLDMTARRHYGAPLAYAAICEDMLCATEGIERPDGKEISLIILDFKEGKNSYVRNLFSMEMSEKDRRKKFYTWFTFRSQLAPSIVFLLFFIFALISTGRPPALAIGRWLCNGINP